MQIDCNTVATNDVHKTPNANIVTKECLLFFRSGKTHGLLVEMCSGRD